jgi:hypothetical protein
MGETVKSVVQFAAREEHAKFKRIGREQAGSSEFRAVGRAHRLVIRWVQPVLEVNQIQ